MIFQSYFSSLVKSGSQGASEAYDKVSQMSKPAIDKAISKAVEIKQAASRKIDSAMQTAHSIEKSASQQVSKAYQQTAVMLKTAEKQLKTLQARSKDTFSRRHLDDLVEQCPKLKKARDEAKKLSEEPAKTKFKAAEQFVGGDYNKDYLSKTSEDKLGATREFKIGVERTKEDAYLVFKSGELKQTVLGKESKRSAELKYDAKAHEASAKVGAEISGAVYKIEDKGSIGHGLVVVKGSAEALSAKATAEGELEVGLHGVKGKVELGVEANLVKGEASGELRITPKTLWDNSGGALFGCEAPNWLDYGLSGGAKGEAGFGAAAKASGAVEVTSKDITATVEAKLGFGPMAGLKLTVGFTSPEEDSP